MLRLIRSLLSVALLLGGLFAMFSVDLGGLTFAEHVDTISETPEAQELVEGTRSRLNPALQELRDRMLGEYVEAPTWIPSEDGDHPELGLETASARASRPRHTPANEALVPASGLEPPLTQQDASAPPEPPLPGRRPRMALEPEPEPEATWEPALPGRG